MFRIFAFMNHNNQYSATIFMPRVSKQPQKLVSNSMPRLTKQQQKPSKPTVMKPITRQCNGCFEEKTTACRHCKCTYTTCRACVKGWILGGGGIIDTTGKFVYTCPQCRRHLAIPPSMLQDADVKQKLKDGQIEAMVKKSQKLLDFIINGSAIIEDDYFEPEDIDEEHFNPSDDDWICEFICRCRDDDGVALQEELNEQEDDEIVSFLQECQKLLYKT